MSSQETGQLKVITQLQNALQKKDENLAKTKKEIEDKYKKAINDLKKKVEAKQIEADELEGQAISLRGQLELKNMQVNKLKA